MTNQLITFSNQLVTSVASVRFYSVADTHPFETFIQYWNNIKLLHIIIIIITISLLIFV